MSSNQPIPVISLIGGIGSGKSALSRELARRHAVLVINADELGHEVLREPAIILRLKETFDPDIVDESGHIVRSRIAARVFGDSPEHHAALRQLEEIVHPGIQSRIERIIQSTRETAAKPGAPQCDLIILDAALLIEAGWDQVCDLVFFVDVPEEIRLTRVTKNRNWSEAEFRKREQSQISLQDKQARADYTIANHSDLESAVDQLETYLNNHFHLDF